MLLISEKENIIYSLDVAVDLYYAILLYNIYINNKYIKNNYYPFTPIQKNEMINVLR